MLDIELNLIITEDDSGLVDVQIEADNADPSNKDQMIALLELAIAVIEEGK